MIRPLLVVLTCISTVLFPWPLTALLALCASVVEPLIPLSAGLLTDALYLPQGVHLPVATLLGLLVTLLTYFVRSRLATSII
jgi:hypothetical protein